MNQKHGIKPYIIVRLVHLDFTILRTVQTHFANAFVCLSSSRWGKPVINLPIMMQVIEFHF